MRKTCLLPHWIFIDLCLELSCLSCSDLPRIRSLLGHCSAHTGKAVPDALDPRDLRGSRVVPRTWVVYLQVRRNTHPPAIVCKAGPTPIQGASQGRVGAQPPWLGWHNPIHTQITLHELYSKRKSVISSQN